MTEKLRSRAPPIAKVLYDSARRHAIREPAVGRRQYRSRKILPSGRRLQDARRASAFPRTPGVVPAAMKAAASSNALAALSGCTRRNRAAASRRMSLGSISCQSAASCSSQPNARTAACGSSAVSRSGRTRAETHSTFDPHHTSMAGSLAAKACKRRVEVSAISNGTIAEASQNLTDFPGALRGGL